MGGISGDLDLGDHRLSHVLTALRADLEVNERYVCRAEPPLGTPVTALGGTTDPRVNETQLAAWRTQTSGSFALHTYRGGHFYLAEPQERDALLRLVVRTLLPAER